MSHFSNFTLSPQFYSITTSITSLTTLSPPLKVTNYMEWKKRIFFTYVAASAYHLISRRDKIVSLGTNAFLDTHVCIKNPYWQSSRIIKFFCKYIVISDTLIIALGCVFLVGRCNIIRASWNSRKKRLSYRKTFVWGTSFFACTHSFLCHVFFIAFFVYSLLFVYSDFRKKNFVPKNGGGKGVDPAPSPSVYSPAVARFITSIPCIYGITEAATRGVL